MRWSIVALSGLLVAVFLSAPSLPALAQNQVFNLTIKNHQFTPARLDVPANTKVTLMIKNLDGAPVRFESKQMKVLKTVPANGETALNIGPLKPGEYSFIDTAHPEITGTVVMR